jgi:hypothetical protein
MEVRTNDYARQIYSTDDLGATWTFEQLKSNLFSAAVCAGWDKITFLEQPLYLYSCAHDYEPTSRKNLTLCASYDLLNWREVGILYYGEYWGYSCITANDKYVFVVSEMLAGDLMLFRIPKSTLLHGTALTKSINANTDVDNLTEIGDYFCPTNSISTTLLNIPDTVKSQGFIMATYRLTGNNGSIAQNIMSLGRLYNRIKIGSAAWSLWECKTPFPHRVIALSTNIASYTAPCDGYLNVAFNDSEVTKHTISVNIPGDSIGYALTTAGNSDRIMIPLSKGSTASWSNTSLSWIRFCVCDYAY